jgi:FOG: CheY-like receiver
MPGGIRNGFIKFVNKVLPDGLPIPGRADSAEDEEEEKFDTDLHLYDREGLFYVLIIDNNYLDLEHEKIIFENAGCSVSTARTGAEGLEQIIKDKYDIILVAADLPRMDGIQTLKNMNNSNQSKCRDSKVYIILSETDKSPDAEFLALGFHGIIRKPAEKCVLESIIIDHAPKKMLPEDERTINYIKELAETTKRLKRCDVRLSTGLIKFNGDIELYKQEAAKFCQSFDESKDRAFDALALNDQMNYMDIVREYREESRILGAIHLADIFDDHVNMAKDDTLEVAQNNWKSLVSEWKYVVAGMADWLGKPEYVTSVFEPDKIKSNGIWISEADMRDRVEDIIEALVDLDEEYAESMMKLLMEYDFDDVIRRKLLRGSRLMDTDTELAIEIFRSI